MQCPRCPAKLIIGRVGGLSARGCPRCSGVWLDPGAQSAVVGGLTDEMLSGFRKHTARANVDIDEAQKGIACPVCQRPMRRHRIERAWLDVDICDAHGTWYDRGEVERLAEAFERPDAHDWRGGGAGEGAPISEERRSFLDGFLNAMSAITRRSTASAEASMRRRDRDDDW